MNKRAISKIVISVFFVAFALALIFGGGAFSTVRSGFVDALEYDFGVSDVLYELGIDINDRDHKDDEHFVGGGAEVEFYCMPINGELKETTKYKSTYKCDLILTVTAPSTGYVSDIVLNKDCYSVTVKNSQGYEITIDNLEKLYVDFGQNVSAGQIIGCLNLDGIASITVCKDGNYCNVRDFF